MNNETNNPNGTVLGSVNNNPEINPNPMPQAPQANSQLNNMGTVLDSGNTVVLPNNNSLNSQSGDLTGINPSPTQVMNGNTVMNANSNVNPVPPINNMGVNNQVLTGSQVVGPQSTNTIVSNPDSSNSVDNSGVNSVVTPKNVESPVPSIEPANTPNPTYTNPQTISPAPMPGFESPSTVGTTPPISLESEKKPKKPTNKLAFIVIIIVLLLAVGLGTYYILNYTNILNKSAKANVETKNLKINLGEALPESNESYATVTGTSISNCSKDLSSVNVNVAGVYSFTITCGETKSVGTITVIDNTELEVSTKTVYKVVGDTTITPSEFVTDPKSDLNYSFVSASEVTNMLSQIGTHEIKLTVNDNNGKTTEVTATLIVLEHAIKGELVCSSSNSQTVSGSSANMTVSESFIIVDDGNNSFGKVATEIYKFVFSDETEYKTYLNSYNTDGAITINNIVANSNNVNFDDNNLSITIINILDNSEVINRYGEANLQNYSSIKGHFENNLGYKCTYEKLS